MGFLLVIVILVVIFIIFLISSYNSLVSSRELVRNAMAQIATQVESRWDAVSSLIEATKRYESHESKVLMEITQNRSGIKNNSNVSEVNKDDALFERAVSNIVAVAENYPELKANQVYQTTMESIQKFEDNVRHSRMIYNDSVTKYNRSILLFPRSIIAKMCGFTAEGYFDNTASKGEMPKW